MDILSKISIRKISGSLRDPFFRNSIFLALGLGLDSVFGFLFWTLAARMYTIDEIGIATALISSISLIMAFSSLGLETTIIRFMPSHDHSRTFNTCLWLTTGMAVVAGIVYLAAIDLISPELTFIRDYAPLFLFFVLAYVIALTSGYAFLSLRRADLKLILNLVVGGRLPLLLPFVFLGSFGILAAFGSAYIVAAVLALVLIRRYVRLALDIDVRFIRKTFSFSAQNYVAKLFQNFPILVMPILIVNLLGSEDAALYYVAFAIGSLLLIIPDAMSTSFFVEGSHGIDLRKGVVRNLELTYAILIPAVLFIVLFGDLLLGLFGKDYTNALDLLRIFAVSSLFVTLYNLFIPLQNIRLQVRGIALMNFVRLVLLLGLSYVFLTQFGVIGVGYAWITTYILMSTGIALYVIRQGWV